MNLVDVLENIFQFVTDFDFLANLLLLTFVALYSVFALVLALQIRRLNQTVTQKTFSPIFQIITVVHAIIAILLIFIVVAII